MVEGIIMGKGRGALLFFSLFLCVNPSKKATCFLIHEQAKSP